MNVPRRSLLQAAGGLVAAHVTGATSASASARTGPRTILPTVARFSVGSVKVSFLSDGFLDAPNEVFTGAPPAELARLLAGRNNQVKAGATRIGFTVWLIDDGERRLLIDAGAGRSGPPTAGRLPAALAAIDVRAADVGAVAFTHLHFDHVAGAVVDGRAAFPDAEIYVGRADLEHFTDPGRAAAAPDLLKSSFAAAAQLAGLGARVQRIDGGERALTRAVTAVPLPGHTPGHTGYRIADGGESLFLVGDALFDPALHPGRTDLGIAFEADPPAAAAMRARLFPMAAADGVALAATHMPFPGLGRIVRDGGILRWTPHDFPYDA